MKAKVIFLFLVFPITNLRAQDFDLNQYKYRFQRYQYAYLDFDFQGINNYNIQKSSYEDPTANWDTKKDQNVLSLRTNVPFNYYRVINTENRQHSESFRSDINYYNQFSYKIRNYELNTGLRYYNTNRFYKGQKFTLLDFDVSGNLIKSHNESQNVLFYQNSNRSDLKGSYAFSIGRGKGRLENVTDAVTAMFLLKDLKAKAGIEVYSATQIENIAKGITEINNTRFMDFRFGRIDQLTLLDSTLGSNGILPLSAIAYFTTITDNWLYATRFQRFSGQRWSFNFVNKGALQDRKDRNKITDTAEVYEEINANRNLYNGLEFSYDFSKQFGLHVQRNFGFTLGTGFSFNTESSQTKSTTVNAETEYFLDFFQHSFRFYWGYLYQPNTRTYFRFDLNLNGSITTRQFEPRQENPDKSKNIFTNLDIQPSFSYFKFISPRFYYNMIVYHQSNFSRQLSSIEAYEVRRKNDVYNFPLSIEMGFTYNFF